MWHKIKTWGYLELNNFQLMVQFQNDVFRSNHRIYSVKKGDLENCVNFTEKHLCWTLFLIKLHASGLFCTYLTCFFNASAELFQHIATYYSAPIFLEDLPVNASMFGKLFT